MSTDNIVDHDFGEARSTSALLVLGMHRSGTSAITGALGLCGAWVGENAELTRANFKNPQGFWERRDMREICDRLLHAAEADWWKIARFEPEAIPHAVLAEERTRFSKLVSSLDEHGTWVLKEPRLCLLLPILRDCVTDPVCIHIFRNPLEVARSLQARNGFGISRGLALWEIYNCRALNASKNFPRVSVSYESLVLRPVETLGGILERLAEFAATDLMQPSDNRLRQFINSSLYRHRVDEEETREYLSASQLSLWQQINSGQVLDHESSASILRVPRQHLSDLESATLSSSHHMKRERELKDELSVRNRSVVDLQSAAAQLNAKLEDRRAAIRALEETIKVAEDTIRGHQETIRAREETIKAHQENIKTQEVAIESRNTAIRDLLQSTSWKITAPLRIITRAQRTLLRTTFRILKLIFWLLTGQYSRAFTALFPYYKKYVPRFVHEAIPGIFRDYIAFHFLHPAKKNKIANNRSRVSRSPTVSTYIVPASWCARNPDATRSLVHSGQHIIVTGLAEVNIELDATMIYSAQARSLALAAVTTRTAIEVDVDAAPSATAWSNWSRAVEDIEERKDRGVRLLTPVSLVTEQRTSSGNGLPCD